MKVNTLHKILLITQILLLLSQGYVLLFVWENRIPDADTAETRRQAILLKCREFLYREGREMISDNSTMIKAQEQEINSLKEQVRCPEHKFVFDKVGDEKEFRYHCSVCGLDIVRTWEDLSKEDRDAIETLGLQEKK